MNPDLLWLMQQKIKPLEEKLAKDGSQPYSTQSAMELIAEKIADMKVSDLAEDLIPLFEQRSFIEAWLEGFKEIFLHIYKAIYNKDKF